VPWFEAQHAADDRPLPLDSRGIRCHACMLDDINCPLNLFSCGATIYQQTLRCAIINLLYQRGWRASKNSRCTADRFSLKKASPLAFEEVRVSSLCFLFTALLHLTKFRRPASWFDPTANRIGSISFARQ
jgi:hypothetical protein